MTNKPLNRDVIKYIAMLTMLLNHVAHVFLQPGTPLYTAFIDIGYFTAPVMCFFLTEGYEYTRSKRKYGQRLLAFALLSQIPYDLAFGQSMLNMLFTLFFCFLLLYVRENVAPGAKRTALIVLLVGVTLFCDWSFFAPAFVLSFANCRQGGAWDRKGLARAFVIIGAVFAAANYNPYVPAAEAVVRTICCASAVWIAGAVILFLYNGRRAKHGGAFSKWFFYLFYPGHIAALVILRDVIFKAAA